MKFDHMTKTLEYLLLDIHWILRIILELLILRKNRFHFLLYWYPRLLRSNRDIALTALSHRGLGHKVYQVSLYYISNSGQRSVRTGIVLVTFEALQKSPYYIFAD